MSGEEKVWGCGGIIPPLKTQRAIPIGTPRKANILMKREEYYYVYHVYDESAEPEETINTLPVRER